MNDSEIQKRINAMPAKMAEKGLRQPIAHITFRGNEEPQAYANWKDKRLPYENGYEFLTGATVAEALKNIEDWVDNLPSKEDARKAEFLGALSNVIELGRTLDIDVGHINPLMDTMKRLSENIITFQPAAE